MQVLVASESHPLMHQCCHPLQESDPHQLGVVWLGLLKWEQRLELFLQLVDMDDEK